MNLGNAMIGITMASSTTHHIGSFVVICGVLVFSFQVGGATPAWAGDTILMEAHTLNRDGTALLRVIPSAHVVASRDLVFACQPSLVSSDDVLVFNLDTGQCSIVPANRRSGDLTLAKPVTGEDDLRVFDTVNECLAGHQAALVDDDHGLAMCFRWYFCDELSPQITGPTQICEGSGAVLDAGLGFATYFWEPGGETTPDILVTPLVSTEYTVSVADDWACAGSDSLVVDVLPAPEPAITGPIEMCTGETVILDAGAGWAGYDWSTGAATQTIAVSPAASTVYEVIVVDGNGCSGVSLEHLLTVDEVWDIEIYDQTVDSDTTIRSCSIIRAGPETHVVNASHLILQAGEAVILRNGFSVEEGARLTIRLEAALNPP